MSLQINANEFDLVVALQGSQLVVIRRGVVQEDVTNLLVDYDSCRSPFIYIGHGGPVRDHS